MLAYVLAIAVAMGSLAFYLVAFFLPEVHRRQDFAWSGVGLFYALVLWFCAGRMTGAVLLGQLASGSLVMWLGWQTLALRWALTPPSTRTPVTWSQVRQRGQGWVAKVQGYWQGNSALAGLQATVLAGRDWVTTLFQGMAGPRQGQRPDQQAPTPSTGDRPLPLVPQLTAALGLVMAAATGLIPWGQSTLAKLRRPKPKRAVIDIAPRPPSIPRSQPESPPTPDDAPLGAESTPDSQAVADKDEDWIGETHASPGVTTEADKEVDKENSGQASPRAVTPPPLEETNWADQSSSPVAEESNWAEPPSTPEEETNWEDAPSSLVAEESNWAEPPSPIEEETNWENPPASVAEESNWAEPPSPIEEETNWENPPASVAEEDNGAEFPSEPESRWADVAAAAFSEEERNWADASPPGVPQWPDGDPGSRAITEAEAPSWPASSPPEPYPEGDEEANWPDD